MGKRLEQQPMYPQYTYYYPHYLHTKNRFAAIKSLRVPEEQLCVVYLSSGVGDRPGFTLPVRVLLSA
ncbi:unnamed protein product [Boreogadus saida]